MVELKSPESSKPSPLPIQNSAIIEQKNLKKQAMDHIRCMFLNGELNWGDLVSEETLAKQIGISRTPVREALNIFTQLGILKRVPRYGTIVRTPDLREFEELFDVRRALECFAIEMALPQITADEISNLEKHCKKQLTIYERLIEEDRRQLTREESLEFQNSDYAFHHAIIRTTSNRMLIKHITDNQAVLGLLGIARVAQFDRTNVEFICNEHEAILEAIREHDPIAARKRIDEHILTSKRGVLFYMKKKIDALENNLTDNLLGIDY